MEFFSKRWGADLALSCGNGSKVSEKISDYKLVVMGEEVRLGFSIAGVLVGSDSKKSRSKEVA